MTGAGGFIGSHMVDRLARADASVRAFVRYNSRNDYGWLDALDPDVRDSVEIFRGDLANPEAAAGAVIGCDVVLHLGALIPIPYSYVHPREFVAANVTGTINVLEAARRADLSRLVHISTSEVYGTAQTVPIAETHPLNAQSPYAATKVGADQLALSYVAAFETPIVIARPFNTFGPRQSSRAVIPSLITQALTRDQVDVGATTPTRDFVFVEDTVEGMLACADAPNVIGEVVNLGTGIEISIGEVADRVVRIVGREIPIVTDEQRLRPGGSEVERLIADGEKARTLLNWSPRVDFDEGLSRTVDWLRTAVDRYKPSLYNV